MARRIRQWIGFLIMLAGLGLLAGPFLLGAREEKVQEQVVDTFYQDVKKAETEPAANGTVRKCEMCPGALRYDYLTE